ncbi:MAG: phenylacetate--CoA ligase family protein, partial [Desulfobacteraceae bacterium]|nr:phenylacetate--CoA ligase family protein [Desulfobacteraceae bacterium]
MKAEDYWNPEMELMPEEKLAQLRFSKLKKQLAYVYKNSELYRQKFNDAGAMPEDITDMETFRKLPIFLNKEQHRQSQVESMEKYGHALGMFMCAPKNSLKLVSATSGTTGPPTYYLFTKKDLEIQSELAARAFWMTGLRNDDVILHGAGLSGMYLGGTPVVNYVLSNNIGTLIPVGAEPGAKKLLETVIATNATALIATPSYLQYLAEVAHKHVGRDASDLGIKRLYGIGEPGAGLPEVREQLNQAYNAQIFDLIGPGTNFAAASCSYETYEGMHHLGPEYVIHNDLVDPETKEPIEIKDGAVGEQVRTAIDKEAGPFIRYSVGDIIQISTETCKCGRPGDRIRVIGRVDDMLIVKGVNVFPAGIKNVIMSFMPRVTGE